MVSVFRGLKPAAKFKLPLRGWRYQVVCNDRNAGLRMGDKALLRPYEGEMDFDQLPDTLELLHPTENQNLNLLPMLPHELSS